VVAIGRWNEPAKNKKDGRNERGKEELKKIYVDNNTILFFNKGLKCKTPLPGFTSQGSFHIFNLYYYFTNRLTKCCSALLSVKV
jgi:hypothetical protein